MKKPNKIDPWTMIIMGSLPCLMFGSVLISNLLHRPIGIPCAAHAVDGVLKLTGRSAYLVRGEHERHILAYRSGKGGTVGPLTELEEYKPGSPVHAEFCGSTLVDVAAIGNEIYRLTQEDAEAKAKRERNVFLGLFTFFLLIPLLGVFKLCRGSRSE